LEETAFDIEPYLQEEDCISKEVMGKRMKLYIIPGVDHLTTQFFPKCKGVSAASTCYSVSLSHVAADPGRGWTAVFVALNYMPAQEIGAYAWHLVSDLPATYDEDKQTFISMDGTRHKFFTVRLSVDHTSCAATAVTNQLILSLMAGVALCQGPEGVDRQKEGTQREARQRRCQGSTWQAAQRNGKWCTLQASSRCCNCPGQVGAPRFRSHSVAEPGGRQRHCYEPLLVVPGAAA
jgi:hypothetical protein